ncbi:MAG TPA: helicase-associated domain-containing protein, partial [Thermomicrobiales bacterium]|nr:helicase-associated domain-containing protein [Thermomicrobiales bacterium]
MTDARLIFQRNGSMLVTPGDGLDKILRTARLCAQLRSIVAGSYVYDLSPVALWGAAARGVTASELLAELASASSMPVPAPTAARIAELIGRYGAVEIVNRDSRAALVARSRDVLVEIGVEPPADGSLTVALAQRDVARTKLAAVHAG